MSPRSIDTHKTDCPCPACIRKQGRAKIQRAFRLDAALVSRLERTSIALGLPQNHVIERALQKFFEAIDKGEIK